MTDFSAHSTNASQPSFPPPQFPPPPQLPPPPPPASPPSSQVGWVPPTPEPLWFEVAASNAMAWFRRNSPAQQPARWLASLGSLLLLIAGVAMTVANWRSIPTGVRLGGLLGVHLIIAVAAERLRIKLPDVAQALAHLAAGLFAASGIQAVSTIGRLTNWDLAGGRWPACCLVGGIAALCALEVQHRRWSANLMRAGQVIAASLGGAGAAALTGAPFGVILAVFAAIAFSFRRPNQATTFGIAALATPVLGALFDQRWGFGTATRLGTIGPKPLAWAAPLAAAVASVVLVLLARERRAADPKNGRALIGTAAMGLLYNAILGISYVDIDFSFSVYTTGIWIVLTALAIGLRNKPLAVISCGLLSPVAGLILLDIGVANQTHAAMSGGLFIMSFAALALRRRSDFILWSSAASLATAGLYAIPTFESGEFFRPSLAAGLIFLGWSLATIIGATTRKNSVVEVLGFVGATLSLLQIASLYLHNRTLDAIPLLAVAALVAEFVGRVRGVVKVKYPYVMGTGLLAIHALTGAVMYESPWRNAFAVAVAVVMIAVGVFSILNSVTMMGVGTLFGALAITFGPAMADLPMWMQFAAGGVVLIGLAVVIERRKELARTISAQDRAEALGTTAPNTPPGRLEP